MRNGGWIPCGVPDRESGGTGLLLSHCEDEVGSGKPGGQKWTRLRSPWNFKPLCLRMIDTPRAEFRRRRERRILKSLSVSAGYHNWLSIERIHRIVLPDHPAASLSESGCLHSRSSQISFLPAEDTHAPTAWLVVNILGLAALPSVFRFKV